MFTKLPFKALFRSVQRANIIKIRTLTKWAQKLVFLVPNNKFPGARLKFPMNGSTNICINKLGKIFG